MILSSTHNRTNTAVSPFLPLTYFFHVAEKLTYDFHFPVEKKNHYVWPRQTFSGTNISGDKSKQIHLTKEQRIPVFTADICWTSI